MVSYHGRKRRRARRPPAPAFLYRAPPPNVGFSVLFALSGFLSRTQVHERELLSTVLHHPTGGAELSGTQPAYAYTHATHTPRSQINYNTPNTRNTCAARCTMPSMLVRTSVGLFFFAAVCCVCLFDDVRPSTHTIMLYTQRSRNLTSPHRPPAALSFP